MKYIMAFIGTAAISMETGVPGAITLLFVILLCIGYAQRNNCVIDIDVFALALIGTVTGSILRLLHII